MKFILFSTGLLLLALSINAADEKPTLPKLVTSSRKFSILVDLLKYTNLLDAVVAAKDVTIFAPTNFGFRKAISGFSCEKKTNKQAAACIKATLNKEVLSSILKYHVVPGLFDSTKVLKTTSFATLNGQKFKRRGTMLIDNTPGFRNPVLVKSLLDLKYDKGIVHAINSVLLPIPYAKASSLVDVAASIKQFRVLFALLEKTGLTKTVLTTNYITVFAPTDWAFRASAKEIGCPDVSSVFKIVKCIIDSIGVKNAAGVLAYHLVDGVMTSDLVTNTNMFTSFAGVSFFRSGVTLIDQAPAITNPRLLPDLLNKKFKNGVLHGISRVLVPFNTGAGTPCDQIEFPLSLADGSFYPLFKVILGMRRCKAVREAVLKCELMDKEVCTSGRGKDTTKVRDDMVKIGVIVAAAKKCKDVASALMSCNV